MGFFSIGKKDKKKKDVSNKTEQIRLNSRRYDRYLVKDKELIDISKSGARLKKESSSEIKKDFFQITINNKKINARVVQDRKDEFSIEFLDSFEDFDFIKNNVYLLTQGDSQQVLENIDFDTCSKNDTLRAVINLLAELEDPNTTSEKMITYIRQIPDLEIEILDLANSVEEKAVVEIKDLCTAIARLGFNKLKKIVRDVVNRKISLDENSLSFFEYFEAFNIFKTIFFKETAPLFSFKDIKNEGRTLLSTETAILSYFTNQNLEIKRFYKNPKRIYHGFSRVIETELMGIDLLHLGKSYFVDYLGFFKYLYDGYILAHIFLNPYLDLGNLKVTLSQRKLRFAYVAYLTFISTIGVIQRDRRYMYISLNRLSRFGMEIGKALEYINSIVSAGNNALSNMGLRRSIKTASIPSYKSSLKDRFPKNIYFSYLLEKLQLVNSTKRVSFRHEDRWFVSFLIDMFLNAQDLDFKNKSFCIVPCKNIDNEGLDANLFEGFDIVIFKDVDLLPSSLYRDFTKIWREFEGFVFSTYSTDSFLDFKNPDLYKLINPYIVDIPSFFNKSQSYEFLKTLLLEELDGFFEDVPFQKEKMETYKNHSFRYILSDIVKTSYLFP
ncbi:MAG: HDOD domain-containing protein [Aquificae bacterium]|nr:HDOD domain-containing protein [Aquificota bacterium]